MNTTAAALAAFAIFLGVVGVLAVVAGLCWGRLRRRLCHRRELASDINEKTKPAPSLPIRPLSLVMPKPRDMEAGLLAPEPISPRTPRYPDPPSPMLSVPPSPSDPFSTPDSDLMQRSPVSFRGENIFGDFDRSRSPLSTPAERAAMEEEHGLEYPVPALSQDNLLSPSVSRTMKDKA